MEKHYYYVQLAKNQKGHIIEENSIQDDSFRTLCGRNVKEPIRLINPHQQEMCQVCHSKQ